MQDVSTGWLKVGTFTDFYRYCSELPYFKPIEVSLEFFKTNPGQKHNVLF